MLLASTDDRWYAEITDGNSIAVVHGDISGYAGGISFTVPVGDHEHMMAVLDAIMGDARFRNWSELHASQPDWWTSRKVPHGRRCYANPIVWYSEGQPGQVALAFACLASLRSYVAALRVAADTARRVLELCEQGPEAHDELAAAARRMARAILPG